jgi:hypothetical protein
VLRIAELIEGAGARAGVYQSVFAPTGQIAEMTADQLTALL